MKKKLCALLVVCMLICSTGCQKTTPMSEQLATVFEKYHFSPTMSSVNLNSNGYYVTQIPPKVLHQPGSTVVDYIGAAKRVPEKAVLGITYAEYSNEQDAKNVFENEQKKILSQISESGTGYSVDNYVIGFYVPTIGNNDNTCLFYILYKSDSTIVYINEQGPLSYVEENQDLVAEVCKTVCFDPTDNYNKLINDLRSST